MTMTEDEARTIYVCPWCKGCGLMPGSVEPPYKLCKECNGTGEDLRMKAHNDKVYGR